MKAMRHEISLSTLAAALFAALGTVPLAAHAATITVTATGDSGGGCTLRQAIVSMNAGDVTGTGCAVSGSFGTNDTITFDTATFPAGATNTITLIGGQLSITAYYLTIDASANANVTIDANQLSRVMYDNVINSSALSLNHLTLRNGRATANDCIGAAMGGGICIPYANLTLTDSTLSGNSASYAGGGILSIAGNFTLTRSTLSNNTAAHSGGAIQSGLGTVTLTNSTLSGNSATLGGGIDAGRLVTLTASTLSGNSAPNGNGGGIYCNSLTLINSTLSGNSAVNGNGGAIFIYAGNATLTNSTLSSNSASTGGGIYTKSNSSTLTLTNSTLSGNSATNGNGGAIYANGTATLTNSTLSGNSAAWGGGIYAKHSNSLTTYLTLTNATVSANSAGSFGGGIVSGAYTTVNNSIVAGNTQASGSDLAPGFASGANNLIGGDPMLGALADNGGPTWTMLLLAGSPAIDAGNNANCPATDQRGVRRPQAANCDIGAVELVFDRIFADNFDGTPTP